MKVVIADNGIERIANEMNGAVETTEMILRFRGVRYKVDGIMSLDKELCAFVAFTSKSFPQQFVAVERACHETGGFFNQRSDPSVARTWIRSQSRDFSIIRFFQHSST